MILIYDNPIAELEKDFARWNEVKKHGCCYDPFYCDGVNLNLIRGHIIAGKQQVKLYCAKKNIPLPEIYHRETPPEADNNYMARPDEIRKAARLALSIYEADSNYQKLRQVVSVKDGNKKQKLQNVLGYVSNLRRAIEEDDLVYMRLHDRPKTYLKSFKSMLEELAEEDFQGQLSLFGVAP